MKMKPSYDKRLAHMLILFSLVLIYNLKNVCGYMVGNNPYHRREVLDSRGNYQLEWAVDWAEKRVNFTVYARTLGAVGFGLSSGGKMSGSDIVIGGVGKNGRSYLTDYHSLGHQIPVEDPSQDWTLHSAVQTATHTQIKFSRAFDTCDPQDYPITEDKISLIWSIFETDTNLAYHRRDRGSYQVYLLHRDYSPAVLRNPQTGGSLQNQHPLEPSPNNNLDIYTFNNRFVIPAEDTTYWCTMHRGPNLTQKHHMVGYEVYFPNEQSRLYTHHLTIARCRAPAGRSDRQMFASWVGHRGQLGFIMGEPLGPMPTDYCTEYYSTWAVGGRPFFYPPHVGVSMGSAEEEYYLMQVHYNNPNKVPNIEVEISIDYHLTKELRPNEGGIMVVRHTIPGLPPSMLIPPSSLDHSVYGMCGSECTRTMLPREGIRINGLMLHTHNVGSAVRLQHFRGNRELPWVISDNNYGFDYQQFRNLNREVRVMPGDFLSLRCTYDNTRVNGTVVGGFSSQMEMCTSFISIYQKNYNYIQCYSQIESEGAREKFLEVRNVTWSTRQVEYITDAPHQHSGLKMSEVSDQFINWDTKRRSELQDFHNHQPHVSECPRELNTIPSSGANQVPGEEIQPDRKWQISFPHDIKPYQPPQSCSFRG